VSVWFVSNKLSLNISKTCYMIFCQNINDHFIKIDGQSLTRTNTIKFLGLHLDDKLTWKNHIKHVESQLTKITEITLYTEFFHMYTFRHYYVVSYQSIFMKFLTNLEDISVISLTKNKKFIC
jgi:hypothetical protein